MKVFELSKEFGITNKEMIEFFQSKGYKISNHSQNLTDEMIETARSVLKSNVETKDKDIVVEDVNKKESAPVIEKKTLRQFNQNDLILCRSVTAGWLGVSGKSGQYYVFVNFGDECEIEYQDLFALKNKHSSYIYAPLFVIEDDELLDNPRWADVKKFYDEKVYTMEDVDAVLNLPVDAFKSALSQLPRGLAKSLQVKVAEKIEDGTFDSINKIKIIDETFGTDFMNISAR